MFIETERNLEMNGEVGGYVEKWGSLANTIILGAGHLVPTNQMVNLQTLIEDWVLDKGLFGNAQKENFFANSLGPMPI